jgi:hypothetical protein
MEVRRRLPSVLEGYKGHGRMVDAKSGNPDEAASPCAKLDEDVVTAVGKQTPWRHHVAGAVHGGTHEFPILDSLFLLDHNSCNSGTPICQLELV